LSKYSTAVAAAGKPHDLEGYFESLALQGFQNNLFSSGVTKE